MLLKDRKTDQLKAPFVDEVARALKGKYNDFDHFNKRNPLDELLFIICSLKRSEKVYCRAFKSLKAAFPKFQDLAAASHKSIIRRVAWGGLQNQKALSVKRLMQAIEKRYGKPTLAPLRNMNDNDCESFLTSLPGVGKKVSRCVMLYALGREVFPVDSHCWRIATRLGWIDSSFKSKNCTTLNMDKLQDRVPAKLRYSLHVNMVSLGRDVCTARQARCFECVITDFYLKKATCI